MDSISDEILASIEFGSFIHGACVRLGSKAVLAKHAGVDVTVIETMTTGFAVTLGEGVLKAFLQSIEGKNCDKTRDHLYGLVARMYPSGAKEMIPVNTYESARISNPLTCAERRPQMA